MIHSKEKYSSFLEKNLPRLRSNLRVWGLNQLEGSITVDDIIKIDLASGVNVKNKIKK